MKIIALNGSPKKDKGATVKIIKTLQLLTGQEFEVFQATDFLRKTDQESALALDRILDADVLFIVFPLYVDALPMPLIRTLELLEERGKEKAVLPKVYAISQCGFFEATQNQTALRIIRNFCQKTGFNWQYGIGIGAGGFLGEVKELGGGPTKPILDVLESLCSNLKNTDEKREDVFVSPSMPRFLYTLGGSMGWKKEARKNRVKRSLDAQPFTKSKQ